MLREVIRYLKNKLSMMKYVGIKDLKETHLHLPQKKILKECKEYLEKENKGMAWEVNECLLKDCPLLKDKKKVILFQPEDIRRIKALLKKFEHKEWLLYLYGDIVEDGAIISGMTIPKQEVSGGSVDEISPPLPGCIGTIHSHNSMGAFHSGTDQAHLETNHTVAITVNNKLEFDSTIQIKSECNRPVLI